MLCTKHPSVVEDTDLYQPLSLEIELDLEISFYSQPCLDLDLEISFCSQSLV
jgi:hypothetical protein